MANNFFKQEEKACEMKSSVQVPLNFEYEENLRISLSGSSEKTDDLSEDKIAQLLQEKLHLDERERELRSLTISLQQEHRRLTAERQMQERAFMRSNKNATSVAREIRNRLLVVYTSGKENERAFEKFLELSKKKLRNTVMLNADNNAVLQRKLTRLESAFSLFLEQLTTLETLLKPDYDILCEEGTECFTDVMIECNKVEESIYNITSLILEE